jgi:hypothetical protein
MESELEDLDLTWIDDIIENEIEPESNSFIKLHFFYIQNKSIIKMIEHNYVLLTTNVISKEELIQMIKQHNIYQHNKYCFLNINYINFTENNTHMKSLMSNQYKVKLNHVQNIEDICLQNTIPMFQDLNEIHFFLSLREKPEKINNTKKILINSNVKTRRNSFK